MTELTEQSALGVGEERRALVTDHNEGVTGAHHAGVAPPFAPCTLEVPVVAMLGLESLEEAFGEWERITLTRGCAERETDVIGALKRFRVLKCQVGHAWHSIVFKLPIA